MINKKVLTVKDVFNIEITGRIYINEMHDKEVYNLLIKVRAEAKKMGYKNPYVRGDTVFVKRDNLSEAIAIKSIKDLEALSKVND